MTVLWSVDPTSEDAANAQLDLVGTVANVTYRLTEMDLTPPEISAMYAASADTEGDPFVDSRFRNRIISLGFIATATTDAALQTGIQSLQQKLEKLRREGGTLKMTTQAGTTAVGDVNYASFKPEFTPELYSTANHGLKYTLDFECKPAFRGAPVQLSDHVETTLPVAVGVDTAVGGDLLATVHLLIDEDQAADQWWVIWGLQSRYYDSATSAALFYEAEGRTLQGGAAIVTQTGASGGGTNNAVEGTLTTTFQSILSTQAASAGAHLSHVGNYRVFARVLTPTANTGAVSIALQWGEGDFRSFTQNAPTIFPVDLWDNTFRLVDLGQVHLSKVAAGTQRWEGRIIAKSTVFGDKLRIDHFFLVPVDEGSGEVSAVFRVPAPTAFSARDEFDQTAGNLGGKVPAGGGGTWLTAGDTTDFAVEATGHTAQRSTTSDPGAPAGRRAVASATAGMTGTVVQVDVKTSSATADAYGGVVARCQLSAGLPDSSNMAYATVNAGSSAPTFGFQALVAGGRTPSHRRPDGVKRWTSAGSSGRTLLAPRSRCRRPFPRR